MSQITDLINGFSDLSVTSAQKRLTTALKKATTADQLTTLWTGKRHLFNHYCTGCFLNRLSRLPHSHLSEKHKRVLAEVLTHAGTLVDVFDGDGIRLVSNALRELKPQNCRLFSQIKSRLFRYDRAELESQPLQNIAILCDVAVVLEENPDLLLEASREVILAQKRLEQAAPSDLASLARSFTFEKEPSHELYSQIERVVIERDLISTFEPALLAWLAQGASFAQDSCQVLLKEIARRVKEVASRSEATDLRLFKIAIQCMDVEDRDALQAIRKEMLSDRVCKCGKMPLAKLQLVADGFTDLIHTPQELLQRCKMSFASLDPVTAMRIFCNTIQPDLQLVFELTKRLIPALPHLSAKELVRLSWAFPRLPHSAHVLVEYASTTLRGHLPLLSNEDLVRLAQNLAICRPLPVKLMEAIRDEAMQRDLPLILLAKLYIIYRTRCLISSTRFLAHLDAELARQDNSSWDELIKRSCELVKQRAEHHPFVQLLFYALEKQLLWKGSVDLVGFATFDEPLTIIPPDPEISEETEMLVREVSELLPEDKKPLFYRLLN